MIYCVEDDENIRELVVYTLINSGIDAKGLETGEDLLKEIEIKTPALILLDIMLPGLDGLQVLKQLKASHRTKKIPVIMLTAKGSEYDKVVGLNGGADDYISKPFGMMELIARVKAALRRTEQETVDDSEYSIGELYVNISSHTIKVSGKQIFLTYKEFELISYLLKNIGIVMTRDKLLEHIWGYDSEVETRTVDVHIKTLRSKLGTCGDMIETVRGVGYKIGETK